MREIKFRALDFTKTWNYGYVVMGNKSALIFPKMKDGKVMMGVQIYVLPDTIGQFTGLHDKNGKDIYEGDIVTIMRKPEHRQTRVLTRHIATCDSVTSWTFRPLAKEVLPLCMAGCGEWDSFKFEVIGNIYDTPELAQPQVLNLPERKPKRKKNTDIEIVFKFK